MQRFPYGKTFVLGLGFFGISIIWPLFNSLIPPMLEDLGLSAVAVGFILTWDNIINMFFQPWIGSRSDRTRSRFGRRKPWLMVGAPLAALFFCLVPFARTHLTWIALAILGTNLGMALFRSPTIAYLGDLFQPSERSKANGVINLMGGLGGAVALLGGGALYKIGVPLPFLFGAAVLVLAILVVLLVVRDTPAEPAALSSNREPGVLANLRRVFVDSDRSALLLLTAIFAWFIGWNAMEAFFTIYARDVLGVSVGSATQMLTAFAAALIVFAIPSGLIATRLGRQPTIQIGLAGMLAGLVVGYLLRSPILLLIDLALMGAFWALININSLPMVYDLGGTSGIGASTGLYYLASSAAAIAGPILAGKLIDLTSRGSIWMFSAVFMVLAAVLMLQIRPRPAPKTAPDVSG